MELHRDRNENRRQGNALRIGDCAAGAIDPLAPLAYSLADAPAALRQLSSARAIGKIVTSAPLASGRPSQEAGTGRWLVSGGLGALGTLSARYVIDEI